VKCAVIDWVIIILGQWFKLQFTSNITIAWLYTPLRYMQHIDLFMLVYMFLWRLMLISFVQVSNLRIGWVHRIS
jgi:hypothetical protein